MTRLDGTLFPSREASFPPLAVVGMGAVFAGAQNACELWNLVKTGADASAEVPPGRWPVNPREVLAEELAQPDRVHTTRGFFAQPPALNPQRLRTPLDQLQKLDAACLLALEAAAQAVEAGGLVQVDLRKVGVILGHLALPTESVCRLSLQVLGKALAQQAGIAIPLECQGLESSAALSPAARPASAVADAFQLGGTRFTLDAACASSYYALALAAMELASGRLDAVLAGGVCSADSLYTHMGFSQLHALSPSGRSLPFDHRGDGLMVGEGAGIFLVKRLADAVAQGDHILGVIRAIGLSNDIGGGLLAPNSDGQLRAMRQAYQQAGWDPGDVDLIECHATGTPVGDAVEFSSMTRLWEKAPRREKPCVIGSVKSNVGHVLTAAGAAGLTKVLQALAEKTLPPTAGFEKAGKGIVLEGSPFEVLQKAAPWNALPGKPRRAALSGFGFGGINAHLLLEEWPPGAVAMAAPALGEKPAIAIVGLSARAGSSASTEAFFRQALQGNPGFKKPEHWRGVEETLQDHPPILVNRLEELPVPLDRYRIPPRELESMLPQQAWPLETAWECLRDAPIPEAGRQRTGLFLGVALDLNTTNYHLRWWWMGQGASGARLDAAGDPLTADRTMGALASIAASRIAREFKLGGPSFTLASEENSGLVALQAAVDFLQQGRLDSALVGAVDLNTDPRKVLPLFVEGKLPEGQYPADGCAMIVLQRLEDAVRDGRSVLAILRDGNAPDKENADLQVAATGEPSGPQVLAMGQRVGQAGSAAGILALAAGVLCLQHKVLPGAFSCFHWLRNSQDGARRAAIYSSALGAETSLLLEEAPEGNNPSRPGAYLGSPTQALFIIQGGSLLELKERTRRFLHELDNFSGPLLFDFSRQWHGNHGQAQGGQRVIALLAQSRAEARELARIADDLVDGKDCPRSARDKLFYSHSPLAKDGKIAFVFPGSGADQPGMGRDLALWFPHIPLLHDKENRRLRDQLLPQHYWMEPSEESPLPHERIMGQVAFGCLATDLVQTAGVRPGMSIGYSLGESTALVALGAWKSRDALFQSLQQSPLFRTSLVGAREALAQSWGLPKGVVPDWCVGLVKRSREEVQAALIGLPRAYLLIINSKKECVLGGEKAQVLEAVKRLGCRFFPLGNDNAAVHCQGAQPIAEEYRKFHLFPTTPTEGVRFYSGAIGNAYEVTEESAADAITSIAIRTIDFSKTISTAYSDGARIFLEIGPGATCTRMIDDILESQPHLALALAPTNQDFYESFLKCLAALAAEGVPVNLDLLFPKEVSQPAVKRFITLAPLKGPFQVPAQELPLLQAQEHQCQIPTAGLSPEHWLQPQQDFQRLEQMNLATLQAHEAFLRLSRTTLQEMQSLIEFQTSVIEGNLPSEPVWAEATLPADIPLALDRGKCLEYATGKISHVLGEKYREIDSFSTRVRLPDEPLMLVDRILRIEGEPCSLGAGRVITEHDILPGAWYLDQGRIPTCVAVEAGQADLFLSGYLGIDLKTKGLAVYRLLDAKVTFFRSMPVPGETIHYDIRIDRFFRHNDTYLFRFWYDATVNGEPLMAMRDGSAGFFTAEALAAGKGIVLSPETDAASQTKAISPLVPMKEESFSESQLEALRLGDLAGCFGELFKGLALREPAGLPGGKMRLVHRVTQLEPKGGPAGLGRILAEADIHPNDWFLTCHFIDDQVMPGTLMYECCLHTLRIFLYRMGWVGEKGQVAFEPVPNVSGQLRCRGQVTADTKTVAYEVLIRETGYRPEPYAIVDAYMYADGKNIVEIKSMSLRMSGWTREGMEELWCQRGEKRTPLFDNASILAFATGKPSEAFGELYKVFDSERKIARLPGPPYKFLDRIVEIRAQPWVLEAGGEIVAEYDVPPEEWYFQSERSDIMPFAILLEVALQPCGWLAAYLGSALKSDVDLSFRNLGGKAVYSRPVTKDAGTLSTWVKITQVSSSAGMIVESFQFAVRCQGQTVYQGETTFGFFSKEALANQVGVRGVQLLDATGFGGGQPMPLHLPFPDGYLTMLDGIDRLEKNGGPQGLGFIRGYKKVNPSDWFFQAHFYQDPVWPGSLGLEALIQLLKVLAREFWPECQAFLPMADANPHIWVYRGQVIPHNTQALVEGVVSLRDDAQRLIIADGKLAVDGLVIYEMKDFRLRAL